MLGQHAIHGGSGGRTEAPRRRVRSTEQLVRAERAARKRHATTIGSACRGVSTFDLVRESPKRPPRGHDAELVYASRTVVVADENDSSTRVARALDPQRELHRVGARVPCIENHDVGIARCNFTHAASDLGREASALEEKPRDTSEAGVAGAQEDADRVSGAGRCERIDVGRGHAKRERKRLRAAASLDQRRGRSRCSASAVRAASGAKKDRSA